MPIYEYQCTDCAHEFDELQKMDDAPLIDCPQCNKASLVKLVSAPSFRLKGSGWYETDFKKDKRKNLAEDSSGSKDSKDGASDTKKAKPSDAPAKKDKPAKSETTAKPKKSAGASKD